MTHCNSARKSFGFILLLIAAFTFISAPSLRSQSFIEKMKTERVNSFESLEELSPFTPSKTVQRNSNYGISGDKQFLNLSGEFNKTVLEKRSELIKIKLPLTSKKELQLNLKQVHLLTEDFKLTNSKGKISSPDQLGKFYWGYAEGYPESVVAINIFKDEMSGAIDLGDQTYTLAKLADQSEYILYKEEDLTQQPALECFADDLKENVQQRIDQRTTDRSAPNENNCVRLYIELDHNLFLSKGSVSAAYNYFAGAFSQVAILYANENIDMTLNQVKVWDEEDPYTGIIDGVGPRSGNYLNQFRSALLGTNWEGDLAHLVGTNGGGGVAYVNVLCSPSYAFGYSGINNSYNNVPSYSWTVNVLTHELGHNLGSSHTHACAWNGNNSQIDDCGNIYLANDNNPDTNPGSCYDSSNEIVPSSGGTIMSYCHLNQTGMNFNLGFGPQPGDLIRDRVYNAACLTECEDCTIQGNPCDDGNACTTDDAYDSYCNCIGISSPDNDGDGICAELDPDDNDLCNPNTCDDCTITTVTINVDNYPAETSWEIRNASGSIVESGSGSQLNKQVCLDDGCYDFIIYDSYSDGICCAYGNGSYIVTDADDTVLASGGEFGASETTNFCYSNFTGCTDADEDDICDDVDPCYDPMIMDMGEMLESGSYSAKQEIILSIGTVIPENATIYLNAPTVTFSENTMIPANTVIEFNDTPCGNE